VNRSPEAQIARGAGIVMAGFALSSPIGLLNRMLYSGVFGTGISLDAFFSANRVPDILFSLMAGMFVLPNSIFSFREFWWSVTICEFAPIFVLWGFAYGFWLLAGENVHRFLGINSKLPRSN